MSLFFFALVWGWTFFDIFPYDASRWIEAMVLSASFPMAMAAVWRKSKHLVAGAFPLLIAAVCYLISIWGSDVGWYSWVLGVRFLMWLALFVSSVDWYARMGEREAGLCAAAFIVISFSYSSYVLIGNAVLLGSGIYDRSFLASGFSNVNHAAAFAAISTLVMPAMACKASSVGRIFPILSTYTASVYVLFISIMESRGAWIAILVAPLIVLILLRSGGIFNYIRRIFLYLLGGLSLFLVFQIARVMLGVYGHGSEKSFFSDSGRWVLYGEGLKGTLEKPFFGSGPLSYAAMDNVSLGHPHNILISSLYENGMVFTVFFCSFLFFVLYKIIKESSGTTDDVAAVSGLVVIFYFVVHSMFSGLSMIPSTVFVLLVGVSLVCGKAWKGSEVEVVSARNRSFLFFLGGAISVVYMLLVCSYWNAIPVHGEQKTRFWIEGGIEKL